MAVTWDLPTTTATISGDNGGSDVVTSQTTISASSTDNSFNDSASGFSGLVDGDRILVKGFTEFQNNGQFIVQSMTSSKIIVYEDLVTEAVGDSVTIRERGAGYTTKDIVDAVSNTTYAETKAHPGVGDIGSTARTKVYLLKCKIIVDDDALWKDDSAVVLMTWNSSGTVIVFNNAYSTIQFGTINNANLLKPYTGYGSNTIGDNIFSCCLSFMSSYSAPVLMAGGDGIFLFYGGMIKLRDDTNTGKTSPDGENETYNTIFPYRTEIVQCSVSNHGGCEFESSGQSRIQEVYFKLSRNIGVNIEGTTPKHLRDIKLIKNDIGFDFDGTNAEDNDIYGVKFRGNTADLRVRNSLTNTIRLIDSKTISTVHATMSFGTGGEIIECNTYNLSVIDSNGDGVNSVRTFAYQKSSGGTTAYGSEQTSSGGSTDTPATVGEVIVKRYQYDSTHTTVVGRLSYGNFAVRLRLYGKKFMDIEKVPEEKSISDTFTIEDHPFVVTAKATVAAYTGIAIDEGNEEIDLTEDHTGSEVFHWLQYKQAESGEMDIEQLFKTNDGVSYTMPASWTITGLNYLDLSGSYIINRYVPVTINGLTENVRCAVVKASDSTVLASGTVGSGESNISLTVVYTAATNVYVRARLAGYKPFSTLVTLGSTGNIVVASLAVDEEHL